MPKVILKLDERELKACAVGPQPVTIGRLPENHLVIDNPAVSGRHARVYRDGDHYVLEDLKSTNGTFVNDRPIARHTLLEGDVVLIGKHTLVFSRQDGGHDHALMGEPPAPDLGGAMVPKTTIPRAQGRVGTVKVIAGKSNQTAFVLAAMSTIIGKGGDAQIKLTGWFKPQAAAAIARQGEDFSIAPMGGEVSINGERIASRRALASGDRIDVNGLTLEFTLS